MICKICLLEKKIRAVELCNKCYDKNWRENNKEKEILKQYKYKLTHPNADKNYYQKNKEKYKQYYQKNKEKYKQYYQSNKEKILYQHKLWLEKNREQVIKINKNWNESNKEKVIASRRKYYRNNRKIIIRKQTIRQRIREKSDINFRLKMILSTRIRIAIKNQGSEKSIKTIELLGCSIQFCREYLEKQFKPGMFWTNYSMWELDHIRPCSSFDLTKEEEQRKCFHYTNLQPLWKEENRIKGTKILENMLYVE